MYKILCTLFIRPEEILEFVYDERARDCKCLLIFELPASNNIRKKYTFTNKLLRLSITT